ncbi:MAG: hypothetical protein QM655_09885 [Nocardioidaceae bacterium]
MSDSSTTEAVVAEEPLLELAGVLDVEPPYSLLVGGEVPPLWHWALFHGPLRREHLGPDGHRFDDVPTAPGPDYSRVYAGGRVSVLGPLRVGVPAERRAATTARVEKRGRSGPGVLVSVAVDVVQDGSLAVLERVDLYYRPRVASVHRTVPEPPAPTTLDPTSDGFLADQVTLFRFSAVTRNAHRIHYDADFARADGHPGILVHGPLQALLLSEHLRVAGAWVPGAVLDYRLVAPAYAGSRLRVVPGADGIGILDQRDTLTARARLEPPNT